MSEILEVRYGVGRALDGGERFGPTAISSSVSLRAFKIPRIKSSAAGLICGEKTEKLVE